MNVEKLKGNSYYFVGVGQYTGNIQKGELGFARPSVGITEMAQRVNCMGFYLDKEEILHVEQSILFHPQVSSEEYLFDCYNKEESIFLGTVDMFVETCTSFHEAYRKACKGVKINGGATLVKDSESGFWSLLHVVGELIYKDTK